MRRGTQGLTWSIGIIVGSVACCVTNCQAQEAMFGQSATFVPRERLRIRPMLHYQIYESSPSGAHEGVEELGFETEFAYGIDANTTLEVLVPLVSRTTEKAGGDDHDGGIGDIDVIFKLRSFRLDTGPINTVRGAWVLGAELPSGNDALSSKSINPMAGYAITWIRERHGGSASVLYKMNTSDEDEGIGAGDSKADLFALEGAYLYRVAPDVYTSETAGAWFVSAEAALNLETNGDSQILIGPGVMYEAKLWAFEAAIQVPVAENLDHRPELKLLIAVGFRFLF